MSTNPFELHAEFNGKLTRIYIGSGITIWFSYEAPVAFAINGYGTVKSENVWTSTTGKHLASIPAKEVLPRAEFQARLALLAHSLDDEASRAIGRPSWENTDAAIEQGTWIAQQHGWEV